MKFARSVKWMLIAIMAIGFTASLLLAGHKHMEETENRAVNLVMDYKLFKEADQLDLLPELRDQGITSAAVFQKSLEDLEEERALSLYPGREMELLGLGFDTFQVDPERFYVLPYEKNLFEDLYSAMEQVYGEAEVNARGTRQAIEITAFEEQMLEAPLVYPGKTVQELEAHGLDLVLRVPKESDLDLLYSNLDRLNPEMVIFQDEELPGYPHGIPYLAQILMDREVKFGFVEPFVSYQDGSRELSSAMPGQVSRVHSISDDFMDDIGVETGISRYVRAVEERNVRTLYLKPFSEEDETLAYVDGLTDALEERGYTFGEPEGFGPMDDFRFQAFSGLVVLGAISAVAFVGVETGGALGILGGAPTSGRGRGLLYLGLFLLGLLLFALLYVLNIFYTRELFALVFSLAVPVGVYLFIAGAVLKPEPGAHEQSTDRYGSLMSSVSLGMAPGQALGLFLKAAAVCIAGGLMIQGILFGEEFIYQTRMFRGVRLQLVLPFVAAVGIYVYAKIKDPRAFMGRVKWLLEKPILVKEILMALVLLALAVLFLTRAGNEPLMPIIEMELVIREFLEDAIGVRPRFKALFGYPLLLLGIYLAAFNEKFMLMVIAGLLGPVTTLNSFSHIHTPVVITLIRETYAVVFGIIAGLALIYLVRRKWRLP